MHKYMPTQTVDSISLRMQIVADNLQIHEIAINESSVLEAIHAS